MSSRYMWDLGGKQSRYVDSHLSRLSLLPSVGR